MGDFAAARSFVFRLTLIYGAIATMSVAVLLAVVYQATTGALAQQLDRAIGAEADSLTSEASMDEPQGFAAEIAVRSSALDKSQFVYALFDNRGARIAGSTLRAPPAQGWTTLSIAPARDAPGYTIRMLSKHLSNGMTLVVGADTVTQRAMRAFFLNTLPAGVGLALLLAFAAATMMSAWFWRRMERVANVCRSIVSGQLSIRAPVSGSGDEIDLIAKSMNAMLDRIATLVEAMRQVTNDIAHDLRTPLARLRQGLERVTLRAQSVEDYEAAVRGAIREADGLLDTFEALLKIAETESGTARASFTDVDLSQVVESVADAYDGDAEANGQHITLSIEPNVTVRGDANLLTQMTANLVENSLRHCPAGTNVALRVAKDLGRAVIVVADNGPGIPAADCARVLGRFVRLERSRTTPGSGLGLSLASAVASLHGARLKLEDNQPGLRCVLQF